MCMIKALRMIRVHNDAQGGAGKESCDLCVSGASTVFEMYYI